MRQPFFINDASQNAFDAAYCSEFLLSIFLLCLFIKRLYEVNVVDSVIPNRSANNERTAADSALGWHLRLRTHYFFCLHLLLIHFILQFSPLHVVASLQSFLQMYSKPLKVKCLAFGALVDV
jgi:hypothetical protein